MITIINIKNVAPPPPNGIKVKIKWKYVLSQADRLSFNATVLSLRCLKRLHLLVAMPLLFLTSSVYYGHNLFTIINI